MRAWEEFLTKQEETLGRETIARWLRPLKVVNFDACNLYLKAEDSFQIAWFEEHLRKKVKSSFLNQSGKQIKIHLSLPEAEVDAKALPKKEPTKAFRPVLDLSEDTLDPAATLDDFLVSPPNELTFKFISEMSGFSRTESKPTSPKVGTEGLNPVFIYGESGSGKTHLLMGCAHALRKQGLSVFYIRAETFTEHVVAAIRNGAMQEFRKAYRHVDVLIVDDVDVFSRRSATQEEFFHTFNTLYGANKQLILSANTLPHQLDAIEPRLVSRFEWGILLHLQKLTPLEVDEWIAKRTHALDLSLSPEAISFLNTTFHGQTKFIEQSIHALVMRTQTKKSGKCDLDLEMTRYYLKDLIEAEKKREVTPEKIVRSTADHYGMRTDDLLGKSQAREAALPRQMAMYLCRSLLKLPYLKIGQLFSRDHSTVMASVKMVEEKLKAQEAESASAHTAILSHLK
ncbi:MAG: ATP-binding protein [Chlamydiales bacterium]|nr:ATP-binding protein [Chlamydiales bacterium]